MFSNCLNLININFGSFNTKNVTTMKSIFFACLCLRTLDLSSFDIGMLQYVSNVRWKFEYRDY